jgi:hypothetical protein
MTPARPTITSSPAERQRILRLLVKDVLIGAEKVTIRHSIPVRHNVSSGTDDSPETDSEGEIRPDCQLRWRSQDSIDVRRGCEHAIAVASYVRVRRLRLLQFGYGPSATATAGRIDSSGTDCRRDQKNTNHVRTLLDELRSR